MKLSVEEFSKLVDMIFPKSEEKPSITLAVNADEADNLFVPIEIRKDNVGAFNIKKLGLYKMDGMKIWVVKQ